jgi:hypothetical protein
MSKHEKESFDQFISKVLGTDKPIPKPEPQESFEDFMNKVIGSVSDDIPSNKKSRSS